MLLDAVSILLHRDGPHFHVALSCQAAVKASALKYSFFRHLLKEPSRSNICTMLSCSCLQGQGIYPFCSSCLSPTHQADTSPHVRLAALSALSDIILPACGQSSSGLQLGTEAPDAVCQLALTLLHATTEVHTGRSKPVPPSQD